MLPSPSPLSWLSTLFPFLQPPAPFSSLARPFLLIRTEFSLKTRAKQNKTVGLPRSGPDTPRATPGPPAGESWPLAFVGSYRPLDAERKIFHFLGEACTLVRHYPPALFADINARVPPSPPVSSGRPFPVFSGRLRSGRLHSTLSGPSPATPSLLASTTLCPLRTESAVEWRTIVGVVKTNRSASVRWLRKGGKGDTAPRSN